MNKIEMIFEFKIRREKNKIMKEKKWNIKKIKVEIKRVICKEKK
jgi:hypothetical protein